MTGERAVAASFCMDMAKAGWKRMHAIRIRILLFLPKLLVFQPSEVVLRVYSDEIWLVLDGELAVPYTRNPLSEVEFPFEVLWIMCQPRICRR